MDRECPWCGEDVMGLVHPTNYDANLEAHVTECRPYLIENGMIDDEYESTIEAYDVRMDR